MSVKKSFDVFDIMGPIMIGPSSSHTAGAVRIGLMAGQLCDYKPLEIKILFYGSLASTYSFHKTDVAVVAGILGMGVDDKRIKNSIKIAKENDIKLEFGIADIKDAHPSTIIIVLKDQDDKEHIVRSATIGGGNILIETINNYPVNLDGKKNTVFGSTTISNRNEFKVMLNDILEGNSKMEAFSKINNGCFGFKANLERAFNKNEKIKLQSGEMIGECYFLEAIMNTSNSDREFYNSIEELVNVSKINNTPIFSTVISYECEKSNRTYDEVFNEMKENYSVMKESIEKGINTESEMLANIFKGNAKKMNEYINSGGSIGGIELSKVIRSALAVMEVNGAMGKILACPTAGSAGTVPAAVITIADGNNIPMEKVVESLFTGAGLGMIIAKNATISGAVGGCQAECGVASGMAAAIITEMFGGDYSQITSALSIAIGNVLGLVCDPVAGTVEIPCIQRNVMAAANAIVSAEMALAGIDSVIPADEIVQALKEVGDLMHDSLKDTLGAGISNTPTGRRIEKRLLS